MDYKIDNYQNKFLMFNWVNIFKENIIMDEYVDAGLCSVVPILDNFEIVSGDVETGQPYMIGVTDNIELKKKVNDKFMNNKQYKGEWRNPFTSDEITYEVPAPIDWSEKIEQIYISEKCPNDNQPTC